MKKKNLLLSELFLYKSYILVHFLFVFFTIKSRRFVFSNQE